MKGSLRNLDEMSSVWGPRLEERLVAAVRGLGVLSDMAEYHLASGGKRLRGLIPLWITGNLGRDPNDAMSLAVCLELMHNGTLVHDDVQDGDVRRRGQDTVWVRWGKPQAINLGDILFFRALQMLEDLGDQAEQVTRLVRHALIGVVQGQALEFELQDPEAARPPTIKSWHEMAAGKTGALFHACFETPFILATQPTELAAAHGLFGTRAGVFFQAQDDLLDLVGAKGRGFLGSDIGEGKISYPVAWAATHAPPERVRNLMRILRTPRADTTREMIADGLALLTETGAIDATAQWLRDEAMELLGAPEGQMVPGLMDKFLEPVADALGVAS